MIIYVNSVILIGIIIYKEESAEGEIRTHGALSNHELSGISFQARAIPLDDLGTDLDLRF
jgi:hypothetical protein